MGHKAFSLCSHAMLKEDGWFGYIREGRTRTTNDGDVSSPRESERGVSICQKTGGMHKIVEMVEDKKRQLSKKVEESQGEEERLLIDESLEMVVGGASFGKWDRIME